MATTTPVEGKDVAPAVTAAGDRLEDRDTKNRSTLTIGLLRLAVLVVALLAWQFVAGAFDVEFFKIGRAHV